MQTKKNFLARLTHTPTLVGKIGYAPWEQLPLGKCFPCSDLYSLGVTAIVLLTGKQPNQLIDYSLKWQWRDYTQVSDAFAQFIDQLIAYSPEQRYQSAQEALAALNSLHTNFVESTYHDSVVCFQPNQKKITKTRSSSFCGLAVQYWTERQ